eukprot:jgi/Psemu1/59797/gm1.59797_g
MQKQSPISIYLECTTLVCSGVQSDLITEGFRKQADDGTDVNPLMIVESHDEGDFCFLERNTDSSTTTTTTTSRMPIRLNEWYDVGHTIGTIDDGDDDDDDDTEEWLWQAYSYQEEDKDRPLNLPPHIATGKITK